MAQEASLDLSQKNAVFFVPVRCKVLFPNAFTSNFHDMSISQQTIRKAVLVMNHKLYHSPYEFFHKSLSQTHTHVHACVNAGKQHTFMPPFYTGHFIAQTSRASTCYIYASLLPF
jgi:hypothetical protein